MLDWLRRFVVCDPEPPFRRMVLLRVVYELFDFEATGIEQPSANGNDELHRQVRLEAADGTCLYISWSWGKGQPDYFLAHDDHPFYNDSPAAERDMSAALLWSALVGKEVTVAYRDRSWQVMEVRADDAVVYCGSYQCDRVFIMRQLPKPCWQL